jgi:hypothetical protein
VPRRSGVAHPEPEPSRAAGLLLPAPAGGGEREEGLEEIEMETKEKALTVEQKEVPGTDRIEREEEQRRKGNRIS